MSINIAIFYLVFLYLLNLSSEGVITDDGTEYNKSSTVKSEPHFEFTVSEDKLTWKNASMACKKVGTFLAILDTTEKRNELTRFFSIGPDNVNHSLTTDGPLYWIGGFREHDFSKFQWENGNVVDSYGWMARKTPYYPTENCLEVKVSADKSEWNNVKCDKLSKYICMYDITDEEAKRKEHTDQNRTLDITHEEDKNLEPVESTTIIPVTSTTATVSSNRMRFSLRRIHDRVAERRFRHPFGYQGLGPNPMYGNYDDFYGYF